tara:strand:+ start:17799 stop:24386 length:6588 start_codon:yes stop_codon:yes gene_type:complete
MVQKRPPAVDTTVIERALGNLPPQEKSAVQEAVKTFPKTDILKRVGRDMTLMEAARTFIGTVGVDKEGRVVSVPAVKSVTKDGEPIASQQLEQRQQKVPYRNLDIKTAASQLQQVLGLPVVDDNLTPTQNFLNLLQTQGDRPLLDVIRDVGSGGLGKERVRGVTEAMVAPKRQVLTEKEFLGDKEAAKEEDLRGRYYLRHRDNPNLEFKKPYTPLDWVDDFDSRISAIAGRQYNDRSPYPTAPEGRELDARAQYRLQQEQRNWDKKRIEFISDGLSDSFFRMRDKDKIPRQVLDLYRDRFPSDDKKDQATSLAGVIGGTLASGREMARKDTSFDVPEFGIMETMTPETKRLLGQGVPMRPDERDAPPEQASPTMASLLQIRDRVDPAAQIADKELSMQRVLEWGRETGETKTAMARAKEDGTGNYMPYLEDLFRRKDSPEVKQRIQSKERIQDQLAREESMDLLYGRGVGKAQKDTPIDIGAGTETAAAMPLRAISFVGGMAVGAAEGAGALAGSLVAGKDPDKVRVLNPATPADQKQIQMFLSRYPSLSEAQKKFVGQAMMEGGDYITDLAKEEIDRQKKMLGKDTMDRLAENSAEIVEGIVSLKEALVGKTGSAYMATGKTAEERVMNSLNVGMSFGKTMGAGAIFQAYMLLRDPATYYEANPVDAILAALPMLKAAQADGRLGEWSKTASSAAVGAVKSLIATGDNLITKLDKKTQNSILGYGVLPAKILQAAGRKAVLATDKVTEVGRNAKASLDRFFKNPEASRELNASLLLSNIIDATPDKGPKILEIQEGFQRKIESDGPKVAADWLEEKLGDTFGPGWKEAMPSMDSHIKLMRLSEEAPSQPRGAGGFEAATTEVGRKAEGALVEAVETVAADPFLGDSVTVTGRLFDDPAEAGFHGAGRTDVRAIKATDDAEPKIRIGARAKHPRYTATSFLLNPEAQPKFLLSDPKATAKLLEDMIEEGKVTYPDGKQPTGMEITGDLQSKGFYDDRVTPTQDIIEDGRGAEFLRDADLRVNKGLNNPEIRKRIQELKNDYVNVMDDKVLAQYGFENTRAMLRSIGVGGPEVSRLVGGDGAKLSPSFTQDTYHQNAGIYIRKDMLDKRTPAMTDVSPGMVKMEDTLRGLQSSLKEMEGDLGVAARKADPPKITNDMSLGEKRTEYLRYLQELQAIDEKVLSKQLGGKLKPSVIESIRAAKKNIQNFMDETYKNPTVLYEDIVASLDKPGSLAESILGERAATLLQKRKKIQERAGKTDVTDALARIDNEIADSLVKDVLGKGKAVSIGAEFIFGTLERQKAKGLQEARVKAIKESTAKSFADEIAADVTQGKKVDSLPAALSEDPATLIGRLEEGGEIYNDLYSKKAEGVSDFAFNRQMENVRSRLKRYVRADKGGKASLDYLGLKESDAKKVFVPESIITQSKWEAAAEKAYGPIASMAKAAFTAGSIGSHFTNYGTYFQTQLGRGRGVMTPMYLLEQSQDIFAPMTPAQLGLETTITRPDGTVTRSIDEQGYKRYNRKRNALEKNGFIDRGTILRELNLAEKAIDSPLDKKKAGSVLDSMKQKAGKLAGAWERIVYGPMKKAYGGMDQIAKWEQAKYSFDYFDDMYNKMAEGETITYRVTPEGRMVTVRKGEGGKIYREDGKKTTEITDQDLADIQAKASVADANAILFDYGKIPNIVKLNKILGRTGISLPFFTYFWKALDIPGYKKGLGEAMLEGVPFIQTSDKVLRKSDVKARLKNAAKINAINMTVRERLKEMPDDLIKEIVGMLPKQARAAFVQNIGIPGMVGVKELDYADPRSPSLATFSLINDLARGRPTSTSAMDLLKGGQMDGVERLWLTKDGKDVDINLDSDVYRNDDGTINELGKKTRAQRKELINLLSKPDQRGTGLVKVFGFGAGIFRDVVHVIDPLLQGDPLETGKVMEVVRRMGTSIVAGSSVEKAVDGAVASLQAEGVDVPRWLESKLSRRLKQFKSPDFEELSANGIDVVTDTMRRITSIGFDVRDVRSDKKRWLKNTRKQLNATFLSNVNAEVGKYGTRKGNSKRIDEKRYGDRSEELQAKLDKLLKYKKQMSKIVDDEISRLDTMATAALNVADRLRSGKAKGLGKPLFTMRDGVKREYRIDPKTGDKVFFDEAAGLFDKESTTSKYMSEGVLDEALGLMGPYMIEKSKESMRVPKQPDEDMFEGVPMPEEEEE